MAAYTNAEPHLDRPSTWSTISDYLTEAATFVAASRRAERLLSLSDGELSRRGLRREDIIARVFRDSFDRR